jgi:serine/threonine protein phosphatase PrpC
MYSIESISFSVQGQRDSNEDSLIVDDVNHVYVVCDGIGGYSNGKLASETVAKSFHDYVLSKPNEIQDLESISTSIVQDLNKVSPDTVGSTIAAVHILGNKLIVSHLGDSKVIVEFNDKSTWSTKDHSLVQELVDADIITQDQARLHPKKNVITKCFVSNGRASDIISRSIFDLSEICRFWIISDGVLDLYNIESLVDSSIDSIQQTQMEQLCKTIAKDNCTLICCKITYGK